MDVSFFNKVIGIKKIWCAVGPLRGIGRVNFKWRVKKMKKSRIIIELSTQPCPIKDVFFDCEGGDKALAYVAMKRITKHKCLRCFGLESILGGGDAS